MAKQKKHAILVVDDDVLVRTNIYAVLSNRYAITSLGDGEQATRALRYAKHDLILTDINMGPINGLELIALVRGAILDLKSLVVEKFFDKDERLYRRFLETYEGIPIIAMGTSLNDLGRKAKLLGATDTLYKTWRDGRIPFSSEDLLDKVQTHLR